ncbi:TM1266 family iron-only hydrogenase system putative regulator [Romboutsia sp.]|uniref:TM1266 family iron-only hydrogenase system putative regulator n=1 Tax=Romboutsia sp. TaxID=1965302 RepID=UPI003F3129F1
MKKIAVISAILEEPDKCQQKFNEVVSSFKGLVKGRMGIPCDSEGVSIICLAVVGDMDSINSLTGKLGNIPNVLVKTSISKKEFIGGE